MSQDSAHAKGWFGNLMMVFSILVVLVGVPMAFVLAGSFSAWLSRTGVHPSPNFSGGYPIAEFSAFERHVPEPPAASVVSDAAQALAVRKFSVRKVAFRPMSGMGIEPRLNLVFEFDGQLPDPQNSSLGFSATVIHVYIKAPGKKAEAVTSDKVAAVDFGAEGWNYQVIIDGLHEQARIFDAGGNLIARGLGLFVNHEYASDGKNNRQAKRQVIKTILTAALPIEAIGDPAVGNWQYYILVGAADTRHPSMMMHSEPDGRLAVYCAAVPDEQAPAPAAVARPRLRPLRVSNHN